jgi:hypothetical protein
MGVIKKQAAKHETVKSNCVQQAKAYLQDLEHERKELDHNYGL